QGVEHVVPAGQIQAHGQQRQVPARALALHVEAHGRAAALDIDGAHLRIAVYAVGRDRTGYKRNDFAHIGVVAAQDRAAVERQAVREVDESALEARDVVAVSVHVVHVDVGDDGHHGQQVQEGGIGFVRLHHDEFALPQTRIGAGRIEPAADDEG